MAVRFVPNMVGIALIGRSPQMVAYLLARAGEVAETAQSIAPVDTGGYRDGISANAGIDGAKAMGRVNAWKFTSGFIEFGTSDTPAFAVLRRACDVSGLVLGPGPT